LYKKGNTIEDIADTLDVSVKEVEQWLGLVGV
jgi:DNA-directed RNA polymerase specialized sigma24 family protein